VNPKEWERNHEGQSSNTGTTMAFICNFLQANNSWSRRKYYALKTWVKQRLLSCGTKKPRCEAGLSTVLVGSTPRGSLNPIRAAERHAIGLAYAEASGRSRTSVTTVGLAEASRITPRKDAGGYALAMMDKETKHEMWLLAVGTALLEMPVVAIVAVMMLTH
jgi:hypothetical protein